MSAQDPREGQGPQVPAKKTGLAHLRAATGYSLAGLRRLMQETATRHQLAFGLGGGAALVASGAGAGHFIGFLILFCAMLAAEALNTAIETVVNHMSPEWSEMGKDAKDLSSLAVGLMIVANLVYLGSVVAGLI